MNINLKFKHGGSGRKFNCPKCGKELSLGDVREIMCYCGFNYAYDSKYNRPVLIKELSLTPWSIKREEKELNNWDGI